MQVPEAALSDEFYAKSAVIQNDKAPENKDRARPNVWYYLSTEDLVLPVHRRTRAIMIGSIK